MPPTGAAPRFPPTRARPTNPAPSVQGVVNSVASVFADPDEPRSLTLVYANAMASRYTGTDLDQLIGKTIDEASPALIGTDLPETYARSASAGSP